MLMASVWMRVEYRSTVEAQVANYQNMAMRTLGFAFKIVDDAERLIVCHWLLKMTCRSLGVVAISDPIRLRICPRLLPNASRQVSE